MGGKILKLEFGVVPRFQIRIKVYKIYSLYIEYVVILIWEESLFAINFFLCFMVTLLFLIPMIN